MYAACYSIMTVSDDNMDVKSYWPYHWECVLSYVSAITCSHNYVQDKMKIVITGFKEPMFGQSHLYFTVC